MQRIFGKYVPSHVVQELARNEGHLRPQMRDATLLYADVEGFTAIAEKLPPETIISVLNELFSATASVVARHGGLVVNYIGDAFVASFNAPLPVDSHAEQAISAARDILDLVHEREFGGYRLKLRIGVATGPVAAGTVGSDDRLSYTATRSISRKGWKFSTRNTAPDASSAGKRRKRWEARPTSVTWAPRLSETDCGKSNFTHLPIN